jgi:hypothetical protein
MSIKAKTYGNFDNTEKFFSKSKTVYDEDKIKKILDSSLELLKEATPVKTGLTAASWSYQIKKTNSGFTVEFDNSNVQNGVNIALLVNDGHATQSGTWIAGRHYLEEPTRKIYDNIMKNTWEELKKV